MYECARLGMTYLPLLASSHRRYPPPHFLFLFLSSCRFPPLATPARVTSPLARYVVFAEVTRRFLETSLWRIPRRDNDTRSHVLKSKTHPFVRVGRRRSSRASTKRRSADTTFDPLLTLAASSLLRLSRSREGEGRRKTEEPRLERGGEHACPSRALRALSHFFIPLPLLFFFSRRPYSSLRSTPPGRKLFYLRPFISFSPSRAKLIDRLRDYHSKNDAPRWKRVKKIC